MWYAIPNHCNLNISYFTGIGSDSKFRFSSGINYLHKKRYLWDRKYKEVYLYTYPEINFIIY